MTTVAEREELKKRLIELVESEPDFVNTLIIDVRNELKRRKKKMDFDQLLEENFKEYDAVFRALA
jgi:hypothetical protein